MRTSHNDYTIITTAVKVKVSGRDTWQLTLEIVNANHERVVGPLTFDDFPLTSADAAHRTGVLVARHWIDGAGASKARQSAPAILQRPRSAA